MVAPRRAVSAMPKNSHGGACTRDAGISDFSINVNPYGPPETVRSLDLPVEALAAYPDSDAPSLVDALVRRHGHAPETVLITHGITDAVYLIAWAFGGEGPALIPEYTYGEYARAMQLMGRTCTAAPMPGYALDAAAFAAALPRDGVAFLCTPNNPTGDMIGTEELRLIADCAAERNTLLVIDEAYRDFTGTTFDTARLLSSHDSLIILRSLTKPYGMPGVRVGYVLGHPDIRAALATVQPPWSIGGADCALAEAALADRAFLAETVPRIIAERPRFTGLPGARHSDANYVLIDVGDAAAVQRNLYDKGILVRDCTSFGLPRHIRVGIRTPKENDRFLAAFHSVHDGLV